MRASAAIANIIDHHLRPQAGRPVVVLCDEEKRTFAEGIAAGLAARGNTACVALVPPDASSIEAVAGPVFESADVGLVVLISHRMWLDLGLARRFTMVDGQPTLAVRCSPVFTDWALPEDSLLRLFGSDPDADAVYQLELATSLPPARQIHLTAPGGTDLTFVSRDWRVSEWTEVLTSPIEDTIEGHIVADASVFFARVETPISLTIEHGRITAIDCADADDATFATYLSMMLRELDRDPARWQLAEVGIGGCDAARLSGIVIEDEAVRGTCHFCFGDNARYGGENACDWHGGTVIVARPRLQWPGGAWRADEEPQEA